jgi:hypothetical protein
MRSLTTFLILSTLSLFACSDSGSSSDPDAAPNVPSADAAPGTADAAPSADAPASACSVSTADFGDKGALTGGAFFDDSTTADDASDDVLEFDALLETASPADGISVILYAGYGAFSAGAIMPGTYEISGEELDFATCGVCVLLATNATADGHEDDYMATGGTVTITAAGTAVGGTLSGTLTNVQFHHVTIDPQTGETTQAADTCTSAMSNATFTGTLAAAP